MNEREHINTLVSHTRMRRKGFSVKMVKTIFTLSIRVYNESIKTSEEKQQLSEEAKGHVLYEAQHNFTV